MNLYAQLDEIGPRIQYGESGSGFFTGIKGFLNDLVEFSQPS